MERFDREISRITKRLQTARQRLLLRHPFYGVLLMHMKFVLDKSCETSYTDGARVLCSKIDHYLRLMLSEYAVNQVLISDISLYESKIRI